MRWRKCKFSAFEACTFPPIIIARPTRYQKMDEVVRLRDEILSIKATWRGQIAELRKALIDKDKALIDKEATIGTLEDRVHDLERRIREQDSSRWPPALSGNVAVDATDATLIYQRSGMTDDERDSKSVIDLSLDIEVEERRNRDSRFGRLRDEDKVDGTDQLPSPDETAIGQKRRAPSADSDDGLYLDPPMLDSKTRSESPLTEASESLAVVSKTVKRDEATDKLPSKRQRIDAVEISARPVERPRQTDIRTLSASSSRSPRTAHEGGRPSLRSGLQVKATSKSIILTNKEVEDRLDGLSTRAVSVDRVAFKRPFLIQRIKAPPMGLCSTVHPTSNVLPINKNGDRSGWGLFLPQRDINLYLPQGPGQPGLLFMLRTDLMDGKPWSLFCTEEVRGVWRYYGDYTLKWAKPLTADEWNRQSDKVHKEWAERVLTKARPEWEKAKRIRARIVLRKRGITLTEDAIVAEVKKPSALYLADVLEAFGKGEEQLSVVQIECANFDHEFHRSLADHYASWAA